MISASWKRQRPEDYAFFRPNSAYFFLRVYLTPSASVTSVVNPYKSSWPASAVRGVTVFSRSRSWLAARTDLGQDQFRRAAVSATEVRIDVSTLLARRVFRRSTTPRNETQACGLARICRR